MDNSDAFNNTVLYAGWGRVAADNYIFLKLGHEYNWSVNCHI